MTTTDERVTAFHYKNDFATMRANGASYQEIGDEYGYTREMIRQVLADVPGVEDAWKIAQRQERQELADEVAEWLLVNGPVMRSVVMETFDLSMSQLAAMTTDFALPSYLILIDSKTRPLDYTEADIVRSLKRVWKRVKKDDPTAEGMAHVAYETHRGAEDPSSALLISRYGWNAICEKAGVTPGHATRPLDSYSTAWDDEDILDAVAEYVRESLAAKERPAYVGYDRWQRGRDYAPSGSHVRNRMRYLGLGTWPEILGAALNRD